MLRDLGGMKTSISRGRKNEANDDEGLSIILCFEKSKRQKESAINILLYMCAVAQNIIRKNIYRAAKPAASVSVYEYIHVSYIFSFLLFLLEKPERSMASVTFPYLVIGCCTLWYCSPSRKKKLTWFLFLEIYLSTVSQKWERHSFSCRFVRSSDPSSASSCLNEPITTSGAC